MEHTFKDPIKINDGKKIKSPWNYKAPPYDERSSCYINAGSHYGVGKTQPIGHDGKPKSIDSIIPRTHTSKKHESDKRSPITELRE